MRAAVYQKLHEFNLHITEGVAALRGLSRVQKMDAEEVRRYADFFEELRSSVSGYVTNLVSDEEARASGHLFGKRRRKEMSEDPMHGGWLEIEREKKKLQKKQQKAPPAKG
jgi:hypothetical protein